MSRTVEWPIAVRMLDVERPLAPLTGLERYSRVRLFVSRGMELIGSVDIWNRGAAVISTARLIDEISGRFAVQLSRASRYAASDDDTAGIRHTISIVVPTRDRPHDLHRCLASLTIQHTRHHVEIVVVDNRPGVSAAGDVVAHFPSVRLVAELRPGLSYARNTGILHATGDIIVATDDDVVAPPHWLDRLVAPFARGAVMAVAGHVLPLELETEAQCRFEAYGGLGKGFHREVFDGVWFRTRRTAVPTWLIGATANAAFRASIFRDARIGLLDEALGAGMPTGCSEDTYLFYRILKADHTIVYEPSAWVWHRHRTSMRSLRAQIRSYSKGHVAYHLTTWWKEGDWRAAGRLIWSLPKTYLGRTWYRLRGHSDYPISLIALEVLGNLAGPFALWRARRRVRRLGRTARPDAERGHAVSVEGQIT